MHTRLCVPLAVALTTGCIGVSQTRTAAPGSAGAAEVHSCRAGTRPAEDGLIDDFEDGNNQGALTGGRDGYWWPKKDTKGSTLEPEPFAPTEGGADDSGMAIRASGHTATGDATDAWGAGFGMNMLSQNGATYDASKYVGISFKAKVGDKSTRKVRFKIGDVNTHQDGGVCKTCWNHFGKDLTLTPKWKEYTVMFSEARQEEGWGDPRPSSLTPSKLIAIDWSIAGGGQDYDVWIDDVQFIECK
jgi:hypothetical protein